MRENETLNKNEQKKINLKLNNKAFSIICEGERRNVIKNEKIKERIKKEKIKNEKEKIFENNHYNIEKNRNIFKHEKLYLIIK